MPDIQINQIDASFIQLICEPHIAKEISESFTFYAPNYQYSKRRGWNGKINLLSAQNLIYAGLFHNLLNWAKEHDYTTDYEYPCNALNPLAFQPDTPFVKSFSLSLVPRQYQLDILKDCMEQGRAAVVSPTASGKSLVIYMLTQVYSGKLLIIVPTVNLVDQMFSDFLDYGADCTTIGRISEQHRKIQDPTRRIQISTWQSLMDYPSEYFEQFKTVIGDECHGFKAKTLIHIMKQCVNAHYRFGFTGTLSNNVMVHELILEGLFGPIIKGETTKNLINQGYLSELKINIEVLEHSESDRKLMKGADYNTESQFLINHKERTQFIKDLVVSLKGATFVLFRIIAHGKELYKEISKERKCYLVYGETEADLREAIRQLADVDERTIVVASYGVFALGVNVPNLCNVVFASPYKAKIKVLQSIGRSLRKTETKFNVYVWDVVDDLSIGSHKNFGTKHYLERIKIYNKEQFDYTIRRRKLPHDQKEKLHQ